MAEIKTKHGLPETKGQFKVRGFVTGMLRDNAFKSIETKNGKNMNILNFGVETAPESSVYVTIQGTEKDDVYFSKKPEEKGGKKQVKKVKWHDRKTSQGEGFNIIGVNVGLEQDENGKNIVESFVEFDAAEYVYDVLEDNTPVFIRGDIEYSSFTGQNNEIRRNKKFNVKQLYGSKSIDFDSDDFVETSDFKQKIIFMGIEKIDDKNDPRFQVEAKIVTYNSIEDADFIIRNVSLANQFKKGLKPYTAIDVWGNIFNKIDSDEIEETNVWGEEDNFKKINKNYVRELVITGADPETIDVKTYTEENINKAIEKLNSTGQVNDNWGNKEVKDESDDDDLPW